MSSEISPARDRQRLQQSQQEELRDLREDFDAQKSAQRSQHESEMRRLKATQQRQEAEAREAGQAAINHIRRSNEAKVSEVIETRDENIARLEADANKNYAHLKQRSNTTRQIADRDLDAENARTVAKLKEIQAGREQKVESTQAELREFIRLQGEKREAIARDAQSENNRLQQQARQRIQDATVKNERELNQVDSDARRELEQLKSSSQRNLNKTREQSQRQLTELRNEQQLNIERERAEANRTFTEMQSQARTSLDQQRNEGIQRLQTQEQAQRQQLEDSQARYRTVNSKVQQEYSTETQRVQREGEQILKSKDSEFRQLQKQQDRDQKSALTADEIVHRDLLARQQREFRARSEFEGSQQEKALQGQRNDFKTRFGEANESNQASLRQSKELLLRELYKQQRDFDSKFASMRTRKEDPFYRAKSFEAQLSEQPYHYELRAKVPAHEKESVQIRVKDGSLSISATRRFDQRVQNEDGSKLSNSSYETWRQDFELPHPIVRDHISQKIDEDGEITVLIPKKSLKKSTLT